VRIPDGAIAWRGPSLLGGGEVALVLTGLVNPSKNDKTGPEIQGYVLGTAEGPIESVRTGRDRVICGDCPQRPSAGGACYVNVAWAPNNVYRRLRRGGYPPLDPEWIRGRVVRWGAYGDPVAVPLEVYERLLPLLRDWQGFTHQWRSLQPDVEMRWANFLMASVEDEGEAVVAQLRGWRTFRIRPDEEAELLPFERICPASEEAGYILDCLRCGQCNGRAKGAGRPNRVIVSHGMRGARFLQPALLVAGEAPLATPTGEPLSRPPQRLPRAPGGAGEAEGGGGEGPIGAQQKLRF
jgi:hypothetical protein